MYGCGPTVYNYFHIGNARSFTIYDVLRRYLEYRGYNVKYVQNFTDIDDKMIANAGKEGTTVREMAEKYIREYFIDAEGLGLKRADVYPRATENIDAIIEMAGKLVDKGYAYAASDGSVYYSTSKFGEYGKLSKQNLEDLREGARVEVDEEKNDAMDFALWKAQSPVNPHGTAHGGREDQAGILSVLRWQTNTWVRQSISIAAGRTWCFPTMRMRSPRVRPLTASLSPGIGCILRF